MRSALAVALVLLAAPVLARDVPPPVYPVRDDAGTLDAATLEAIRAECARLERATAVEIGVLVIDSTRGENHHDFAVRVYNSWGVGKAGVNKGVLLLVAMADRRLEIVPGDAYRDLFTEGACEGLLESVAVPRLRAGKPAEAILEVVLDLARRIRDAEGVAPDFEGGPEAEEAAAFGGGQRSAAAPPPASAAPPPSAPSPPTRPTRTYDPTAYVPPEERAVDRFLGWGGWPVLGGGAVFCGWLGFMIFALSQAFRQGRLIMPRWAFHALSWPAMLVGGGLAALVLQGNPDPPEVVVPGAGAVSGLVLGVLARHICTRCNKWMSITSRTLVSPTYTSTGTGQRTYHCTHCLYHHVETYTIAKKTRTKSSSSSSSWSSSSSSSSWSSSSSSGSFGGGYSSGGGGGASW